jgi:hypothetical protein
MFRKCSPLLSHFLNVSGAKHNKQVPNTALACSWSQRGRAVNWVPAPVISIFSNTLARKSDNPVAPTSVPSFTRDLQVKTYELDLNCKQHECQKESKAIPVPSRGILKGCDMLRIPHCLDSRLTDGGKFISPKHLPRSITKKQYISLSDTHFC